MKSNFTTTTFESVRTIKAKIRTKENDLTNIDYDPFLYDTNACELNRLLAIDPDIFTHGIGIQESYEEATYSTNDCKRKDVEWEDLSLNDWLRIRFRDVSEITKDKILKDHWRKINKEWFKGTNEDQDDLEGIIDYLEPTAYDEFINLDDKAYKEQKCKLLGIPYIKPPPIVIEKVKVTRYSIGPREVYTKVKVLGIDELLRTRKNVATIRAEILEPMHREVNEEEGET
ncbi:hypothetical protein Tco_0578674 [Tanacetum coccineum]